MPWNAYPKYVRNSIINRIKSNVNRNDNMKTAKMIEKLFK